MDSSVPKQSRDAERHGRKASFGEFKSETGSSEDILIYRLANENDARLKVLTKKIVKKTAKDEAKQLNTKLAFCHGYVKPPPGVKVLRVFIACEVNTSVLGVQN